MPAKSLPGGLVGRHANGLISWCSWAGQCQAPTPHLVLTKISILSLANEMSLAMGCGVTNDSVKMETLLHEK